VLRDQLAEARGISALELRDLVSRAEEQERRHRHDPALLRTMAHPRTVSGSVARAAPARLETRDAIPGLEEKDSQRLGGGVWVLGGALALAAASFASTSI
jgi:hypothetical protein